MEMKQYIKEELLAINGLSYKDYLAYCKAHQIPVMSSTSKKAFFEAFLKRKLIKKSNGLYENGVQLEEWDEELLR